MNIMDIESIGELGQYIDALYVAKFVKMMLEVAEDGFGEVTMKVSINNGKIKVVSVNKNQVYSLAGLQK